MQLPNTLITLYLLVSSIAAFSQQPLPRIVESQEFIGPNQAILVYDIETDYRGYVYMATGTGISYFNGVDLLNEKILVSRVMNLRYHAIHKDYDGELWFSNNNSIGYLEKDSLLSYPIPDSLSALWIRGFESIYQDKNGLLHIAPRNCGHYTIDLQGNITEVMTKKDVEINGFVITQLADGSWFHYHINSVRDKPVSIYYLNADDELGKITETQDKSAIYESSLVQHSDNSFSLSIGTKTIIRFRGNELIGTHTFDFNIIKLFVDSRNDLWIGTLDNGLIEAKNSKLSELSFYDKGSATAVLTESHDGGLWCKSSNMGFGYIMSDRFEHYSEQNGFKGINKVYVVRVLKNMVFFSTKNNDIYYLENNTLKKLDLSGLEGNMMATKLCFDADNDTYWLGIRGKLYGLKNGNIQTFILSNSDLKSDHVVCLKKLNGRILGATKSDLFEIKNGEILKISESDRGNIRDFTMDEQGNIWFATVTGVAILEDSLFASLPYEVPKELNTQFALIYNNKTSVWASNENGTLFELNKDSCWKVTDQNDEVVILWSAAIDEKGDLWGLNSDLKLIQMKKSTNRGRVSVEKFEIPYNLIDGHSRYDFAILDENIYMGSNHGLFKQKITSLHNNLTPFKTIFEIAVNNEKVDFDTLYTLNYNENDLRIEFDAINFNQKPLVYSYMLEGYDTTWFETNYKQQHYTNLSPGKYKFKLRTKIKYDEWRQPSIITFNIATPYWQTTWFKSLIVLLILLLIFVSFIIRIRYVRKKEREKARITLELVQLEMRALKAQINPHFIFNSIASAMFYLSKNENEKAGSYLERFSRLIRRVLENSDQTRVKLAEETELMRHYISLESEQIQGQPISFDISYNSINPEKIMIPPTLIQPYIENAIRHGLQKKIGKRIISLSFQIEGAFLQVTIKDNGIGRIAAKKNDQRQAHKSYGMLISSRRIEVLNENKSSGLRITDLYDTDKISLGTSVYFTIPLDSSTALSSTA